MNLAANGSFFAMVYIHNPQTALRPAYERHMSPCSQFPGEDKVPVSAQTILFADDSEDFQKPVTALLSKCGYCVITASGGGVALQKAREFAGAIHLLLSDIEMPGMSGIELASQISQERPDTKILLISGSDSRVLVQNHGWLFLRKPFAFDTLRDQIRYSLGD